MNHSVVPKIEYWQGWRSRAWFLTVTWQYAGRAVRVRMIFAGAQLRTLLPIAIDKTGSTVPVKRGLQS